MRRWAKSWVPKRVWDNLATVSILGLLAVLSFTLVRVVQLAQDGKEAHDAICGLVGDLRSRVDQAQKLLDDNPGKRLIDVDPSPDKLMVSRSFLKSNAANQQRTLKPLQKVKCSAEERKP